TPTPTISSSTGLNFVQVNTVDLNNRRLTVFTAMQASGLSSGTITISWASAVDNITIHLVELNGVDTGGADGAGAIVQSNTVSAGSASSGTVSLSAFGDANNGVLAFFGHNAGESATTPESGYSEIYDTFFGDSAMESEFKATQDTSPSATWSTSAAYRGIALEIKQGAGTTLISVVEEAVAGSGGAGGIDSNTMLLLHCDGADGSTTFTDASQYAHSVSRVGIKVDTGQSKFSGASAQFTKTSNEEISSPDSSDWDFGSGDFTIDFWMR